MLAIITVAKHRILQSIGGVMCRDAGSASVFPDSKGLSACLDTPFVLPLELLLAARLVQFVPGQLLCSGLLYEGVEALQLPSVSVARLALRAPVP